MPENILTETGVLSRVLGLVGQPGGIAGLDNNGQIDLTLYQNIIIVTIEDTPTEDYGSLLVSYKTIEVTRNNEHISDARSIQPGDYVMCNGTNFIITNTYSNKGISKAYGIGTNPNALRCCLSWDYSSAVFTVYTIAEFADIIDISTNKLASELLYNTYQCIDITSVDPDPNLPYYSENYGFFEYIVKLSGLNDARTDSIQVGDVIIIDNTKLKILYTDNRFDGTYDYQMVGIADINVTELTFPFTATFKPHATDTWHLYIQTPISIANAYTNFIPKNKNGYLDASYYRHIDVSLLENVTYLTYGKGHMVCTYGQTPHLPKGLIKDVIRVGDIVDISTHELLNPITGITLSIDNISNDPAAYGICYINPGEWRNGDISDTVLQPGLHVYNLKDSSSEANQSSIEFYPVLTPSNLLKLTNLDDRYVCREEPQPVEFVTQSEYDAYTAKRANTLYVITDASF